MYIFSKYILYTFWFIYIYHTILLRIFLKNHSINYKTVHTFLGLMLCRSEPFLELQSWRTAFHCEVCFQSPLWTVHGAQGSASSWIMAAPMGTESVEEMLFRGKNRNCSRCRPCHCHITDNVHFLQRVRDTVPRTRGDWVTGAVVLFANAPH